MADEKQPVIIRLSPDSRHALKWLSSTVNNLPTKSKASVTNLERSEIVKHKKMVDELYNAAETGEPIAYDRAEEIVCALQAAKNGSVNGSSILHYGMNQAKGYTMYGNKSEQRSPNKYPLSLFKQLALDLANVIEQHQFNYESFTEIQKPLRAQQMRNIPYCKQVAREMNENTIFTADEVKTIFNGAIKGYKEVHSYNVAPDDPVVALFKTARDTLMQSESCNYGQISKQLAAQVGKTREADRVSVKVAMSRVLSTFYRADMKKDTPSPGK